MRQGLAPSPWKKRVVSIGHLLLPFLDCRAVLAHAAGLALNHPFGAFSLAPLSFAVVGNCVGVQEYKGSFFLSFSQPALSFSCPPTHPTGVSPTCKNFFGRGVGTSLSSFDSKIGHLAPFLHTFWSPFHDKSNKRHWLTGSDVRPSLLPHRQPRCC